MATENVVAFQGTLLAGPPKSTCGKFPGGLTQLEFELRPPNKRAAVSAYHVREVNSASSFAVLDGIGSGEAVTQATFLYVRTSTSMVLRFTTAGSPDVVAAVPIDGMCAFEFPVGSYLKMVEVQGSGTLEYFASGNQ